MSLMRLRRHWQLIALVALKLAGWIAECPGLWAEFR